MTPAEKAKKKYYAKNKKACKLRAKEWNRKNRRRKYMKYKEWLDALRGNTPCMDCGRLFPPVCMDFDHRPGEIKKACVASLMRSGVSRATVEAEVAKCDLVCSNCHRIRTQTRCYSGS